MIKLDDFGNQSSFHVNFSHNIDGSKLHGFFEVSGEIEHFPASSCSKPRSPQDELWKKNCFEVFIYNEKTEKYCEWNFSPEGDYAAYYFDNLRSKSVFMPKNPLPSQYSYTKNSSITVKFTISLNDYFQFIHDRDLKKNIHIKPCCILQEKSNDLSYFAPYHLESRPNFHSFKT